MTSFCRSVYGQIFLALLIFSGIHFLGTSVFFKGFLGHFAQLGKMFLGDTNNWLAGDPFHSFSILLSSLANPVFTLGIVALYIPIAVAKRWCKENPVTYTVAERVFISGVACVLAWELATYDYNYYLDHAFYFDRFALMILAVLLFRFPVLTPLFIAWALVYRAQFNYPVAGFPMFDKRMLFDILMMFVAHRYLRGFIKELSIPFFYLVLCIVASNYFASGWSKIAISPNGFEWIANNNPVDLFNNVHLRGWLGCSSPETIQNFRDFLDTVGPVMQCFVLCVELCAIFLLRKRKVAIALLSLLILMHIGIFVFGSMLFWKWILVDLGLIILLIRERRHMRTFFGNKTLFRLSVVVVLLSFLWLRPAPIGWHDTPFNQYFTYEVETADGKTYGFNKNQMNPYHQWFQFDHFLFLVREPVPPVTGFGYTDDYAVARELRQMDSTILASGIHSSAWNFYDQQLKEKYDGFIRTYFVNRNNRDGESVFLARLSPPHHLYTTMCDKVYDGRSPVRLFRVIFNQAFTDHYGQTSTRTQIVDEIIIPD